MGENNNKPIGFIQIDRPYADSRSALRDILGHMIGSLSTEKFSIWTYRSEIRSAPTLGGPFIWFGAHMGFCLEVPAAPLRGDVAEGWTISGKCACGVNTRNLRKKC